MIFHIKSIVTLIHSSNTHISAFFSSSAAVSQRPDHRLYGKVDWDQISSGKYAVVDPMDPSNILYLSPREYLTAQKTWIANDVSVVILATPSDKPSSSDTPTLKSPPRLLAGFEAWGSAARKGRLWGMFTSVLKKHINVTQPNKRVADATGCYELLPQPMVAVNDGNIEDLIREWGDVLHYRLFGLATGRGFQRILINFSSHLRSIVRHNGSLYLAKRLRIYTIVLKAYLGGTPMESTQSLGMRVALRNGLPKALPPQARAILRGRHVQHVRLWLSLLFSYKAMLTETPKPDISGIVSTAPESCSDMATKFRNFQAKFVTMFKPTLLKYREPDFSNPSLHWAPSSGPNKRPSFSGINLDLLAWAKFAANHFGWGQTELEAGDVRGYVRDIVTRFEFLCSDAAGLSLTVARRSIPLTRFLEDLVFDRNSKMHQLLRLAFVSLKKELGISGVWVLSLEGPLLIEGTSEPAPQVLPVPYGKDNLLCLQTRKDGQTPILLPPSQIGAFPYLGKLQLLKEPAGKLRNIAIFDWWSQQFLKPVHDWLFRLLASLPTDATFDQDGSLRGFAKELGKEEIFSFDLKAATEMIPQSLYLDVMSEFLGTISARAWLNLLVDRWFHWQLPDKGPVQPPIRYRRGQPMGALSSWASMALVHHSLLQFAASRVGKFPYWNYRVLGDDIVIGGKTVADSYLEVCKGLSIPISIPKSLQSKNGFFDFASQILQFAKNYSPISLREELAAQRPGRRIEFALRQVRRGLIDFTDTAWFSKFLKFVVPKSVYTDIMEARRVGKVDPAASVVLMELLGTLELALSRAGLELPKVSCFAYFMGLTRVNVAFRESFSTILGLGKPQQIAAAQELTLEALAYKARFVYRKYLALRPFVEKLEAAAGEGRGLGLSEILGLLDPARHQLAAPLLIMGSLPEKANNFREWETMYRRLLKTIDVATRLSPMPVELFEFTVTMSLQEAWDSVTAADNCLLVTPETLLGDEVSVDEVNILNPKQRDIDSAQKSISRLGMWAGLWSVSASFRSVSLGLPGPSTDYGMDNHNDTSEKDNLL